MSEEREIPLRQALLSVIAAAEELGYDVERITEKARAQILGDSHYRQVDHPYVALACGEIDAAHALALQLKREGSTR